MQSDAAGDQWFKAGRQHCLLGGKGISSLPCNKLLPKHSDSQQCPWVRNSNCFFGQFWFKVSQAVAFRMSAEAEALIVARGSASKMV